MSTVKKNYFEKESGKDGLLLFSHWLYLRQFVFLRCDN